MKDIILQEGAGRWALVTGASAGIGRELARVFAAAGFGMILVARRQNRLEELATDLQDEFRVDTRVLPADLADPHSPIRIFEQVEADGLTVDALVNNAGYAIHTGFCATDWRRHADSLQVMGTAVVHLCHLFAPGMKERGYGRILNVASLAAFSPESPGNLYNGVKSLVVHLSRALDLELRPFGIHCTALCPGFTHTEFHEKMGAQEVADRLPAILWTNADVVARQGYAAVMRGQPVIVTGAVNKALAGLMKVVPAALQHELSRLNGKTL